MRSASSVLLRSEPPRKFTAHDEKAAEALILAGLATDPELVETYQRLAIGYRALARVHEHYHPDHSPEPIAPAVAHSRSR